MTPLNHPLYERMTERGIPCDFNIALERVRYPLLTDDQFDKRVTQLKRKRRYWDGTRIHPEWFYNEHTHLVQSRVPVAIALPFEIYFTEDTRLLRPDMPLVEMVIFARLCGEDELADRLLAREKLSDILREPFRLKGRADAMELKSALFKICYGATPRAFGEVGLRYRDSLWHFFPGFQKIPTHQRTPEQNLSPTLQLVRTLETSLVLSLGGLIDEFPSCQMVGIFHSDPLVEYTGTDRASVEEKISALTYDVLRAWRPEETL